MDAATTMHTLGNPSNSDSTRRTSAKLNFGMHDAEYQGQRHGKMGGKGEGGNKGARRLRRRQVMARVTVTQGKDNGEGKVRQPEVSCKSWVSYQMHLVGAPLILQNREMGNLQNIK